MALTHVNFDTYVALRDMDLAHPGAEGQFALGQMASWSRWGGTTSDLTPITGATAEQFDRLGPFSTQIVFFAINLGGDAVNLDMQTWQNFHAAGYSSDTVLKNSFVFAMKDLPEGGIFPAFYMTEVFKLVPTAQGIDHVGRSAEILRRELAICKEGAAGQGPVLVAIGESAYSWLTGKSGDPRIAETVDEVLGDGASSRVRRMDDCTFGVGSNQGRGTAIRAVFDEVVTA